MQQLLMSVSRKKKVRKNSGNKGILHYTRTASLFLSASLHIPVGLVIFWAELQNVSTLAGRGSPNPVFAFWVKFEIIHKGCKLFVGGEGRVDYVVV